MGSIGAVEAHRNEFMSLRAWHKLHRRPEPLWRCRAVHQRPGTASVARERNIASAQRGLAIVAPADDSVHRVAERRRENPLGSRFGADGRVGDGPAFPEVRGVEDARHRCASRHEPCVAVAAHCEAAAACREGALVRKRGWHPRSGGFLPRVSSIRRGHDEEFSIHRIAHGDAVSCVPEANGVKEGALSRAHEPRRPRATAIRGAKDSRRIPDAHGERRPRGDRGDGAKVQRRGASHGAGHPRATAINGANHGALLAARPRDGP